MLSLPENYIKRMSALLGGEWKEMEKYYSLPHLRGIRINTLKMPVERASELGLELEKIPFSPFGFRLISDEKAGSSPFHHAGAFYSQEPSAMSAVTALNVQEGDIVLDMCAAPGGKSTQIAAALNGTGCLWSNEYVRSRANILISNIERCGIRNAVVSSMRPDALAAKTGEAFDKVLVDAPCSGEGMFRREEAAIRDWSEENVKMCAVRQSEILDSAAKCLKPGGVLVYSTCTFSPEENEKNIAAFLERHDVFSLEPIEASFGRNGFDMSEKYDLTQTIRIFPMDGGEGHFVARMRKAGSLAANGENRVYIKESAQIKQVREIYDRCMSVPMSGTPAVYGEYGYILPPVLPAVSLDGVIRAGLMACRFKNGRAEPEHALFMAAEKAECRLSVDLPYDDRRLAAFLHGEEIDAECDSGYAAVCCAGITAGFGKVSGGRLKNRYPKGLRTLY